MVELDFVPKDGVCCKKCEFWNTCPEDYECETVERSRYHFYCIDHGAKVNIIDLRDGNSA